MKIAHLVVSGLVAVLVGGCVLGSVQSFSELSITCTVVAEDTGRPVEGAKISIECDPANPGTKPLSYGPFFTDASGVCRVEVPKQSVWISGSDAFVGGYLRRLVVSAPGFENSDKSEGFEKGSLGRVRELTFRLKRK
ncbi:MAG: hypothetical protein KIT44_14290 [Opitutaceae bacterium]|nr:hypothetical protein [Opitutaceae bacterium]